MPALELGGVGMPQHVRGHSQRRAARSGETGSRDSVPKPLADPPRLESATVFGEQEVGGCAGAGMRVRTLLTALVHPGVERGDRVGVERDGAFGAKLAERYSQPGAGGPIVDDTTELEVKTFAKAQPGPPQQHYR